MDCFIVPKHFEVGTLGRDIQCKPINSSLSKLPLRPMAGIFGSVLAGISRKGGALLSHVRYIFEY